MKKHLIVTADDYGMNNAINDAIEECLSSGIVTATCVMTNMPECSALKELRSAYPEKSLGLHWTLTQGQSVLDKSDVPSLVGSDGIFHPTDVFWKKWLAGRINISELKAELKAQYQCFVELGGIPDFWNTHHNLHVYPGLFRTFVSFAAELGIPAMRSHQRYVISGKYSPRMYFLRHPGFWLKAKLIDRWTRFAEKLNIWLPDGLVYMKDYPITPESFEEVARKVSSFQIENALELAIHPATSIDPGLESRLKESRLVEYQVFSSKRFLELLLDLNIQPVGFQSGRPNPAIESQVIKHSGEI